MTGASNDRAACPPPRVHDRATGLRALERHLDASASGGTALTAAFLDAGSLAAGPWAPVAGNGTGPLGRLAARLAPQVRNTDLIVLLDGDSLLCALPGMVLADGRRRFDRMTEQLGGAPLRLGLVHATPGDSAVDLVANAEAAAPDAAVAIPTRLSLRLAADLQAARRVRVALRLFECDLDSDHYALLALLVTELVTNGVRHGSRAASDSLLVEVATGDRTLRGVVTDNGPGFDRVAGGHEISNGLGLTIVERASTRWGIADEGRRVWFEMSWAGAPATVH